MTMMRWNPMREVLAMQRMMDRLLDETWGSVRNAEAEVSAATLALDVYETNTGYVVAATLPGVKAEDIHITYHDGVLTVAGDVPQFRPAGEEKDNRALMTERVWGKFSRSIRLPQPVQADAIEATYENGVLTLTLPKSPEAQPRMIPVRTANVVSQN
jgi:HSP20 family protein